MRRAALAVQQAVGRGRRLDLALAEGVRELDERDRRFVHELTYGVARLRGRLDYLLARHVRRGLGRLEPAVLEILRLAAYQVLEMDSVPDYAAVSEAVEQAAEVSGKGAAGLANAVLRAVARDGDDPSLYPDPEGEPLAFLSSWGSHPEWLVARWLARWSAEEVRALVEANNRRPPRTLLPLDASPEDAAARWRSAGLDAEPVGGGSGCVRLDARADVARAMALLPAIAQDPGANLVTVYADPDPGMMIADLCAAPGGKALALSRDASYTVAADPSEPRMELVRDNARRTGRRIGLVRADARRPPLQRADLVLLDVPCTGTGTLRRHPDARWRLEPGRITELAALQREMLERAAAVVRPGGLLVYATCTLEPEENAGQIGAFLERRPDFRVDESGRVPRRWIGREGYLEVLPQSSDFDGAFAARMRRRA